MPELLLRHPNLSRYSLKPWAFSMGFRSAALDVLDERGLEDLLVIEVHDVDGHFGEPGRRRGAQASFAGDELEAIADCPDHEGLEHAVVADALGEPGEILVVELFRVAGTGCPRSSRAGGALPLADRTVVGVASLGLRFLYPAEAIAVKTTAESRRFGDCGFFMPVPPFVFVGLNSSLRIHVGVCAGADSYHGRRAIPAMGKPGLQVAIVLTWWERA